jgi:hypothetical protein
MNNQSTPVLQFVKNPDRKTCLPLALFLRPAPNIADFLPDNQGPIFPKGLARGLPKYLVEISLIGSFT